jgi:hypothetical protein
VADPGEQRYDQKSVQELLSLTKVRAAIKRGCKCDILKIKEAAREEDNNTIITAYQL